jgi:glutamine amidotransferase
MSADHNGAVVIVDYGMGNIGSVVNAFDMLGERCTVSNEPAALRGARGIVLPGVGAFAAAMANIRALGLDEAMTARVIGDRIPFLGICLGLQLIAKDSVEHGFTTGLGWIDGHVTRMEPADGLPVPHVGWNDVECRGTSRLFARVADTAHFYFDHTYSLDTPDDVVATCRYGGSYVAAIERDNIFAVQFHPEKSQRNGLRVLRNFLTIAAAS